MPQESGNSGLERECGTIEELAKADQQKRAAAVKVAFEAGGFDPKYYEYRNGAVYLKPSSQWGQRSVLCGHIRPFDGSTPCNRDAGHGDEHMDLRADRTARHTWDDAGRETCDACGHPMTASGYCTGSDNG